MDWLNQLERNRRRGSRPRCVLFMDGGREEVAGRLTRLVGPQSDVIIGGGDRWMPFGKPVQREDNSWDRTPARESRLDGLTPLFARDARGSKELGDQLRKWWLAVSRGANTPNWDIASTSTIKGQRGLLLVEAKAHSAELGESDSCGSRNRGNRERIRWAITEAAAGLRTATGSTWNLSPDSHYQLSNRFAWSWKLSSLGIPVVLLYLGFLNAEEMADRGQVFGSAGQWEASLRSHSEGVVDNRCWGQWIDIDGVPLLPLIRGVDQPLGGPSATSGQH